jgi:hypothetical protein
MNIGAMHGPDTKAAVPKACEHNHEYFISVKKAGSADDKRIFLDSHLKVKSKMLEVKKL